MSMFVNLTAPSLSTTLTPAILSLLRNRRLEVRILWGVLKLIKVVGTHSGGLFLFQFGRSLAAERFH